MNFQDNINRIVLQAVALTLLSTTSLYGFENSQNGFHLQPVRNHNKQAAVSPAFQCYVKSANEVDPFTRSDQKGGILQNHSTAQQSSVHNYTYQKQTGAVKNVGFIMDEQLDLTSNNEPNTMFLQQIQSNNDQIPLNNDQLIAANYDDEDDWETLVPSNTLPCGCEVAQASSGFNPFPFLALGGLGYGVYELIDDGGGDDPENGDDPRDPPETVIPEPSTYLLLGTALMLVMQAKRRKVRV